jgi:hypothetical protein
MPSRVDPDLKKQLGDWHTSQPGQSTRQDLALSGDEATWFPLRVLALCRDRLHGYAQRWMWMCNDVNNRTVQR